MRLKTVSIILLLLWGSFACTLTSTSVPAGTESVTSTVAASTPTVKPLPSTEATQTTAVTATEALTATPAASDAPTLSPSQTPLPTVESLKATVTADLLSCRYGPGAEYLYLYALKAGANIKLIGRAAGNNWVWVDGTNKCWVNVKFLNIAGDWNALPNVYPGTAKLPTTPYYPPASWANAKRNGNDIQVDWEPVPISPGKYEDENMHQYIVEVWRCENGQIVFETLGTNLPYITVKNDEAGCSEPSHGNVWVQEKHGFAGPTKIPWPPPPVP